VVGDAAEVADEAEPGEELQAIVGEIDLPPVEALAGGGHEIVMVVVPAFAESHQGEQPVVLAGVGGREAAIAENVRKRIDGECAVPEEDGAQEKAPDEQRPGTNEPQGYGQNGWREHVVLVQPAEFREFGEVADVVIARVVVAVGKNPADVRPPEAEERRRVQVLLQIGIPVMMAMMRRPPENALLRGRHGHPGDHKLKPAAGLERAVREIPVIAGGDEEHAHFV